MPRPRWAKRWNAGAPARWCAQPTPNWRSGAGGAELDELPLLSALFAEEDEAAALFCAGLIDPILTELRRDPLGQSPLRHFCDDTVTSITVLRRGTTVLSLQAIDGAGLARAAAPASARFAPCETWEHVLAGTASAERLSIAERRPDGVHFARAPLALKPGAVLHRLGLKETVQLLQVPASLVSLKLQRRTSCCDAACEYGLDDGTLLHQAAGSPRDSRLELTATLLGRMGRGDAAPLLAAMAEERGNPSLRWQVLRECLALDSAQGFATLCRIARDGADPLAGHAGALRAQLIETYPQLTGIDPCLA